MQSQFENIMTVTQNTMEWVNHLDAWFWHQHEEYWQELQKIQADIQKAKADLECVTSELKTHKTRIIQIESQRNWPGKKIIEGLEELQNQSVECGCEICRTPEKLHLRLENEWSQFTFLVERVDKMTWSALKRFVEWMIKENFQWLPEPKRKKVRCAENDTGECEGQEDNNTTGRQVTMNMTDEIKTDYEDYSNLDLILPPEQSPRPPKDNEVMRIPGLEDLLLHYSNPLSSRGSHNTSQEGNIKEGCEYIIAKKTAYILSEGNITTGSVGCPPNSNTLIHDEAHQWSSHCGFANAKCSIHILQIHYWLPANKNQRCDEHQVHWTEELCCSEQRIYRWVCCCPGVSNHQKSRTLVFSRADSPFHSTPRALYSGIRMSSGSRWASEADQEEGKGIPKHQQAKGATKKKETGKAVSFDDTMLRKKIKNTHKQWKPSETSVKQLIHLFLPSFPFHYHFTNNSRIFVWSKAEKVV